MPAAADDAMFVQADRLHQIDLDLVAGRDAAHECRAIFPELLRNGEHRRNVVGGMRIIRCQERVVEIKFAHGCAVGPGRPFGIDGYARFGAKDGRAPFARMGQRLRARGRHGSAIDRRDGHARIVDDAVADHLDHGGHDRDRVGGDGGDFPGELVFLGQLFLGRINADAVFFH